MTDIAASVTGAGQTYVYVSYQCPDCDEVLQRRYPVRCTEKQLQLVHDHLEAEHKKDCLGAQDGCPND